MSGLYERQLYELRFAEETERRHKIQWDALAWTIFQTLFKREGSFSKMQYDRKEQGCEQIRYRKTK